MVKNFNPASHSDFPKLKCFEDKEAIKATTTQDRLEHWDWDIENVKYEIKGHKKIRSSDEKVSDEFTYVEYQTYSYPGWIFGKADKIAFEFFDSYIITDRKELLNLVESKLKDRENYSVPMVYKFYERKRPNSKLTDLLVLVPIEDIVGISETIIQK